MILCSYSLHCLERLLICSYAYAACAAVESFYNSFLNGVVEDLKKLGLAVESEGATAVFLEGVSTKDTIGSFERTTHEN